MEFVVIRNRAREIALLLAKVESDLHGQAFGQAMRDGHPKVPIWLRAMISEVQAEYFERESRTPSLDAHRLTFLSEALRAIGSAESEEAAYHSLPKLSDVRQLLNWLASDDRRLAYIDLARSVTRHRLPFSSELKEANLAERREVYLLTLDHVLRVIDRGIEIYVDPKPVLTLVRDEPPAEPVRPRVFKTFTALAAATIPAVTPNRRRPRAAAAGD